MLLRNEKNSSKDKKAAPIFSQRLVLEALECSRAIAERKWD
jgi:hypothetical protein